MVENYAVVDRLRVRFHPGLNLLTGETGSGKSIVVDALGLLLGGRASAEMIRSGEPRARVAGIFDVREHRKVGALLEPAGFATEDGELLIEREILANGKSRAFLGSRPAAAALLRELAPLWATFTGSTINRSCFPLKPSEKCWMHSPGRPSCSTRLGQVLAAWREAGAELEEMERGEQEKLRHAGSVAVPAPGNRRHRECSPEKTRPWKRSAACCRTWAACRRTPPQPTAPCTTRPESAFSLTRTAARRLDEICRIDPSLAGARDHLQAAEMALEEAAYSLRDYLSHLEANPARLDEIESRLAALDRLKRKYGRGLEEVLAFLEETSGRIDAVEHAGERMDALRKERERLGQEYGKTAAELNTRRTQAARKLEKQVERELASLAMERTVFRAEISPSSWTEHGADRVEFLVSPNLGEQPKPLEKVASGGEISRIALALKTCLAAPRLTTGEPVRTLVFDEVDAGIGGSAAEGVGRRLKELAAVSQVLCVTHLPQVASFADHHYSVEKSERNGRTVATVEELDPGGRTREIGRMLSGQKLTPEALKHAEQMIRMNG